MSYQIKSTPFFRRMLTTSKKNGQLQRLKEEYERMKEFNDRAIEMKMRQVRLKRLFKEIEEIKESTTQFPKRRRTNDRSKTLEEIRVETFVKAKELGKEYSKMNALLVNSTSNNKIDHFSYGSISSSKIDGRKKQMIARAVNYGNESSRANLEKISSSPRKKSIKRELKSMSAINENQEKLKQRLNYGNSRSSINMTKAPNKRRSKPTASSSIEKSQKKDDEKRKPMTHCDMLRHSERYIPSNSEFYKNFELLQENLIQQEEDSRKRALDRWHKVALTVRNRFNNSMRRSFKPPLIDRTHSYEFRLRNISNDTDLTLNDLLSMSDRYYSPQHTDGIEDNNENEIVLDVRPLNDPSSWRDLYNSPVEQSTGSKTRLPLKFKSASDFVEAKEYMESKENRECREPTELRNTNGNKDNKECKESKEYKEYKEFRDSKEYLEAKYRESKEFQELKEYIDSKDYCDYNDCKNMKEYREPKLYRDSKEYQEYSLYKNHIDLHSNPRTPMNNKSSGVMASEKVQKLAKIFEPFVREAAQKEAFDGVRKLKHIFEHQTNE